ncbi:hypothetical protein EJ08DRAFT_679678 [Tothia fuscella]|uniref:Uncharacterized protein n=1 Tax=Tothia fuscella TaxID=1048955 RepID=A0A9P4NQB2_9PEZI|nr:hypothetical protein EJ08DRAFT_679678 [Tothia fuscella]
MASSTTDFSLSTHITAPPPLTTVFQPKSWCSTEADAWVLSTAFCQPDKWDSDYYLGGQYYSPGICPYGFSEACTRLVSQTSMIPPVDTLLGEQAVYCCPTFALAVQIRWRPQDLPFLETKPAVPAIQSFNTDPGAFGDGSALSTFDLINTYASLPTQITKDPSAYSTITVTASNTWKATPTQVSRQSQGMSKSTKIGVGVAVPIGVLGFIAAAITGCLLLWRRRKLRKAKKTAGSSDTDLLEALNNQDPKSAQYAAMDRSIQITQSPSDDVSFSPVFAELRDTSNPGLLPTSQSTTPSGPDGIGVARTISHASPSHSNHARVSNLPEVVRQPGDDEEIRQIQIERAKLQERRSRLFQMPELDQEEERLRRRLEGRLVSIGSGGIGP